MMKREFTATVYVMDRERVLLLYHRKLKKWLPPGGHVEENETPPEAAMREVLEETGLEIALIPQENIWINRWNAKSFERPYLCLIEEIPQHQDVPAHQHMDFIYVGRLASQDQILSTEEQLHWFSIEELKALVIDRDIFQETYETIQHIMQANVTTVIEFNVHKLCFKEK